MKYLDCYAPVKIDRHPLADPQIFEKLENREFSILSKDILKPSIIKLLATANLEIENVMIWKWDLTTAQINPPHTDGNYRLPSIARSNGLNWLIEGDSVLDFWDKAKLTPTYGERDDIYYTIWHNPNNIPPEVTCSTFPAIVNPQIPHRVRSVNGSTVRKSVVVHFKRVSYEEVKQRLSTYLISPRMSAEIYKKT